MGITALHQTAGPTNAGSSYCELKQGYNSTSGAGQLWSKIAQVFKIDGSGYYTPAYLFFATGASTLLSWTRCNSGGLRWQIVGTTAGVPNNADVIVPWTYFRPNESLYNLLTGALSMGVFGPLRCTLSKGVQYAFVVEVLSSTNASYYPCPQTTSNALSGWGAFGYDTANSVWHSLTTASRINFNLKLWYHDGKGRVVGLSKDAYVTSGGGGANTNYGNQAYNWISQNDCYALIKADLPADLALNNIEYARLQVIPLSTGTHDHYIARLDASWVELSVTWNNKPTASGERSVDGDSGSVASPTAATNYTGYTWLLSTDEITALFNNGLRVRRRSGNTATIGYSGQKDDVQAGQNFPIGIILSLLETAPNKRDSSLLLPGKRVYPIIPTTRMHPILV